MRNVTAQIEKGTAAIKNNWRLDMSANEMQAFYDSFKATTEKAGISDAIWETVSRAYKMGLAVGLHNSQKRAGRQS